MAITQAQKDINANQQKEQNNKLGRSINNGYEAGNGPVGKNGESVGTNSNTSISATTTNATPIYTTMNTQVAQPSTQTSQPDYFQQMKDTLASQNDAQTALYNQQAADQAAKIKQALAQQQLTADANLKDLNTQYGASIDTLNTDRAKLPQQTTDLNNDASLRGQQNASKIRNAMAQMGILQSGESASQGLQNDTNTSNQVNANNLQQQTLDADFGQKIATAQQELANKSDQIRQAMALAQSQGDENALTALKDAQAQINASTAANATALQNWQYQIGRDTTSDNQWNQTFNANQAQLATQNAMNAANLTGVYNGQQTIASKQADASIANTNAQTTYQQLVNAGYPAEQAAKMAQASANLMGTTLANQNQQTANQYQAPILQGQINQQTAQTANTNAQTEYQNLVNQGYPQEQAAKMAQAASTLKGTNLQNDYQTLVNAGYPAQQAMDLATKQANIDQGNRQLDISQQNANTSASSAARASTSKSPTSAEINAQQQQLIGKVTSAIYDKVYGQNSSNAAALSTLTSNKGGILSDLTSAGMSATDALKYYQSMYEDLGGK